MPLAGGAAVRAEGLPGRALSQWGDCFCHKSCQAAILSASVFEAITFHQVVPGFGEGFGALGLELGGQGVHVNAGFGKLSQHVLAVSAVGRHRMADLAMSRQRPSSVASGMVLTVNGAASAST